MLSQALCTMLHITAGHVDMGSEAAEIFHTLYTT